MTPDSYTSAGPAGLRTLPAGDESALSGVSWGAVLAGAVAAAALSFILLVLGTGLGLSAVSPWANDGASGTAIGISTALWLAFTQLAAAGIGGYLAGRLRTRWSRVHTDEVYFRDTAHGLVTWALATLVMAGLMGSAVTGVLGSLTNAAATAGGAAVTSAVGAGSAAAGAHAGRASGDDDSGAYWTDVLFRAPLQPADAASAPAAAAPVAPASPAAGTAEAGRILLRALRAGALPEDDAHYLGQLVAQRTGLPQAEADKRVADTFARAKQSVDSAVQSAKEKADAARKATAHSALWMFVALLLGAFVAALTATFGGRQRDSDAIVI